MFYIKILYKQTKMVLRYYEDNLILGIDLTHRPSKICLPSLYTSDNIINRMNIAGFSCEFDFIMIDRC